MVALTPSTAKRIGERKRCKLKAKRRKSDSTSEQSKVSYLKVEGHFRTFHPNKKEREGRLFSAVNKRRPHLDSDVIAQGKEKSPVFSSSPAWYTTDFIGFV